MNFDSNSGSNDEVGSRCKDKLKVSELGRLPPALEEHLILNGEEEGSLDSGYRVILNLITAEVLPIGRGGMLNPCDDKPFSNARDFIFEYEKTVSRVNFFSEIDFVLNSE